MKEYSFTTIRVRLFLLYIGQLPCKYLSYPLSDFFPLFNYGIVWKKSHITCEFCFFHKRVRKYDYGCF